MSKLILIAVLLSSSKIGVRIDFIRILLIG